MGVHSACDGSCQNIQVESLLSARNNTNTHMDNTTCHGVIRLFFDSKHELLGTCMWASFWLWMGSRLLEIPGATRMGFKMDRGETQLTRKIAALRLGGPEDVRTIRCSSYNESVVRKYRYGTRGEHAKIRPVKGMEIGLRVSSRRSLYKDLAFIGVRIRV